jgi:hypothetical protein
MQLSLKIPDTYFLITLILPRYRYFGQFMDGCRCRIWTGKIPTHEFFNIGCEKPITPREEMLNIRIRVGFARDFEKRWSRETILTTAISSSCALRVDREIDGLGNGR